MKGLIQVVAIIVLYIMTSCVVHVASTPNSYVAWGKQVQSQYVITTALVLNYDKAAQLVAAVQESGALQMMARSVLSKSAGALRERMSNVAITGQGSNAHYALVNRDGVYYLIVFAKQYFNAKVNDDGKIATAAWHIADKWGMANNIVHWFVPTNGNHRRGRSEDMWNTVLPMNESSASITNVDGVKAGGIQSKYHFYEGRNTAGLIANIDVVEAISAMRLAEQVGGTTLEGMKPRQTQYCWKSRADMWWAVAWDQHVGQVNSDIGGCVQGSFR